MNDFAVVLEHVHLLDRGDVGHTDPLQGRGQLFVVCNARHVKIAKPDNIRVVILTEVEGIIFILLLPLVTGSHDAMLTATVMGKYDVRVLHTRGYYY